MWDTSKLMAYHSHSAQNYCFLELPMNFIISKNKVGCYL